MNITIGFYTFHNNEIITKGPFEIIKETEKCYFINQCRFLKNEIGVPILKSATKYPYIELVMVDADKATLNTVLSTWFSQKALDISSQRVNYAN